MNRLSKQEIEDRDRRNKALRDALAEVNRQIDTFNAAMDEHWRAVEDAVSVYNEAVGEVNGWLSDIHSAQEAHYDEKSEKWQEGERGEAYQSWMQEFENEVEEAEVSKPDDVDAVEPGFGPDEIENLPEEPEQA